MGLEDDAGGYAWRLIQNPLYRGAILDEATAGLDELDTKKMFYWLLRDTVETLDHLIETHQHRDWYLAQIEAQAGIAELPTN